MFYFPKKANLCKTVTSVRISKTKIILLISLLHYIPTYGHPSFLTTRISSVLLSSFPNTLSKKTAASTQTTDRPVPEHSIDIPTDTTPMLPWMLVVGLITLGGMSAYSIRQAIHSDKLILAKERQLKFYQVQALQSQLNPHLLFNVLQTIINQHHKHAHQEVEANLIKLSTFLRNFLDSSIEGNKHTYFGSRVSAPLKKEIELLQMYLDLEQSQISRRFDYTIDIDPAIDLESSSLPPMIIQPFVENAIKHGVAHKSELGQIHIRFQQNGEALVCRIEDNGVGRNAAAQIQSKNGKKYPSRGTDLVKQRVDLLSEMGYDIQLNIIDKPEGGTAVEIQFSDN